MKRSRDEELKRWRDEELKRWTEAEMKRRRAEEMNRSRDEETKSWRDEQKQRWRDEELKRWTEAEMKRRRAEEMKSSRDEETKAEELKRWRAAEMKRRRAEELKRWRAAEMKRWRAEEQKRWRAEEMKRWRDEEMNRWRAEEKQIWRDEELKRGRDEEQKRGRDEEMSSEWETQQRQLTFRLLQQRLQQTKTVMHLETIEPCWAQTYYKRFQRVKNEKGSEGRRRTEWKLQSFSKWVVFMEMEGAEGKGFLFLVSHLWVFHKAQVVFQCEVVLYSSVKDGPHMCVTYDPLWEIQVTVSKSHYEITSIKVWFQPVAAGDKTMGGGGGAYDWMHFFNNHLTSDIMNHHCLLM